MYSIFFCSDNFHNSMILKRHIWLLFNDNAWSILFRHILFNSVKFSLKLVSLNSCCVSNSTTTIQFDHQIQRCAIFHSNWNGDNQRWSPRGRPWPRGRPRGHILKSLALASKVKSLALALASKPQVLENCPVLGSRTALFFKQLKFPWKAPETSRKICEHLFCFPHLEHRRSQGEDGRGSAPFPIEISPMTKMWQKSL